MSVFTMVKAPQELPAKHKKRSEKPLYFFDKMENVKGKQPLT